MCSKTGSEQKGHGSEISLPLQPQPQPPHPPSFPTFSKGSMNNLCSACVYAFKCSLLNEFKCLHLPLQQRECGCFCWLLFIHFFTTPSVNQWNNSSPSDCIIRDICIPPLLTELHNFRSRPLKFSGIQVSALQYVWVGESITGCSKYTSFICPAPPRVYMLHIARPDSAGLAGEHLLELPPLQFLLRRWPCNIRRGGSLLSDSSQQRITQYLAGMYVLTNVTYVIATRFSHARLVSLEVTCGAAAEGYWWSLVTLTSPCLALGGTLVWRDLRGNVSTEVLD